MNKDEYLKELEKLKKNIQETNEQITELKETYIEENKPCQAGDSVTIVLQSGRKVSGEAKTFGILSDGHVHVISYKATEGGMKYITVPTQSTVVIK